MKTNRRNFLYAMAAVPAANLLPTLPKGPTRNYPISCNTYNWLTFYGREGKNWGEDLESCLGDYARTGLTAIEPSFGDVEQVKTWVPHLQKFGLALPSIYVNSLLHQQEEAEQSIKTVLAIADAVKPLGTKIIVTNPTPIRWGGTEAKSDAELAIQLKYLEQLGAALRRRGLTLAYHVHSTELLAAAREFHHMMLNTSPQHLAFCFDVHWIYRGSQDSQAAVFDVLKLYGKRIVELHLRQSQNGIWTETFGAGDIDYPRLVQEMKKMKLRPHLVIEQCVETQSPQTMDAAAAHIQDLAAVQQIFAPIL